MCCIPELGRCCCSTAGLAIRSREDMLQRSVRNCGLRREPRGVHRMEGAPSCDRLEVNPRAIEAVWVEWK
jgi:hypothetical protein